MKALLIKICVFLLLLTVFFALGGSRPATVRRGDIRSQGQITKAWLLTVLLYVSGAAIAVFGNEEVGLFPPISLKPIFIVLGSLLMCAGLLWMRMIKESAAL